MPELVDRHDPAAGRRHARCRRPRSAGAPPPRRRSSRRRRRGRPAPGRSFRYRTAGAVPRPAYAADDRVLEVEHERAIRVDQLGEPALDPPVGLERAVAVEVVGGHVRVDGDASCRATGPAAGARTARRRPGGRASARAAAPPAASRCCRRGSPGGAGPRRGSRGRAASVVVLPLVPVTPIVGDGAQPQEQVRLADTRAGASTSRRRRAPRRAPGAAPRSRGSVVG